MHLQQKRGWSPRSCAPAAMCSGYAGHYRNHLTAGSLAALKRDFNITKIEGVSTRITTEALASAGAQNASFLYVRQKPKPVSRPGGGGRSAARAFPPPKPGSSPPYRRPPP